jgi:nitroreductase
MTPSLAEREDVVGPSLLLERMRWRYATKSFDPARKIPVDVWNALEETLVLSPSSFGLQPWRFIVVSDPLLRRRLRKASGDQSQVVDASHLVVFASKTGLQAADVDRLVRRMAVVRGVDPETLDGCRRIMTAFVARAGDGLDIDAWSAHQLYIALGVFLTSAALLGIDACPMERIEPGEYDAILGLGTIGYQARFAAAAGYRAGREAQTRLAKVRFAKADVLERR